MVVGSTKLIIIKSKKNYIVGSVLVIESQHNGSVLVSKTNRWGFDQVNYNQT